MADIIDVNIGDSTLEVFWQDEVELSLDMALMYIKSGEAEIQKYVDEVSKPEISNYVETEAKPLVTQIVNEIAEPTVMEYIDGTVKPDLDEYADSLKPELQAYVTQASNYANNSQASATASAASASAAKASETNALSSKNSAATSAQNAANSATEAKGYAQDAATSASLANIENKITNCLTAIPQDIKLELNNGTLTLKAGSKVYVPNGKKADGSLKFDVVTVASDIGGYNTQANTKPCFMYYIPASNILQRLEVEQAISGASDTITGNWHLWYDTTNNICYMVSNTGVKTKISLPLAIVTFVGDGTTKISSIDQVFNGFGYIGSTIFSLPGVEGLIPNGFVGKSRNNIKVTTSSLLTYTNSIARNNAKITLYNNGIIIRNTLIYDKNINRNFNGSTYSNEIDCGTLSSDSTGRITSFNPKTVFQATDYYDVPKLAIDNTFTGTNTFEGTSPIKIDRNGNAYVEVMSANNGVRTGGFRNNSDNHNSTIMYVTTDDGSTIKGNIAVVFDGTNTYATCPTPPSTSDNSTKIPTTNWVRSFLATVYPVGSLFFSTASTCPLQSLGIGTWNKVGTSLTLSVNTSVPVKGNGITLGLTDGSANYGLANSDTLYNRFSPYANAYGTSIGNTDVGSFTYKKISFGITTDASKSGVVGTVTRTQITVNVFQRTA